MVAAWIGDGDLVAGGLHRGEHAVGEADVVAALESGGMVAAWMGEGDS